MKTYQSRGFIQGSLIAAAALSMSACSINIPAAMSAAWSAAQESISQDTRTEHALEPAVEYRPRLELARAAFTAGHYGIAIDHLNAELAQRPASVAALNGLGASYDQLGRYDVAGKYYFQALELAPTSATTLSNIGFSYLLQHRYEEAAAVSQLALQYDTENKAAAANLLTAQTNQQSQPLTAEIVQSVSPADSAAEIPAEPRSWLVTLLSRQFKRLENLFMFAST
jgi:Flp pilus assembly protein TadD